jgi:REP element-mobilizing transposase RayT
MVRACTRPTACWTDFSTQRAEPGGEADHIRDEADYQAHVRYCWINPVKHGLVERPEDWPYSSYHRHGGTIP